MNEKRASFELADSPWDALFLVQVSGHLATREKKAVAQLLERSSTEGRPHLLLDLTRLSSLGGGVARLLATECERRCAEGLPPLGFLGASDTVQSFLSRAFGEHELVLLEDLGEAPSRLRLDEAPPRPQPAPAATPERRPNQDSAAIGERVVSPRRSKPVAPLADRSGPVSQKLAPPRMVQPPRPLRASAKPEAGPEPAAEPAAPTPPRVLELAEAEKFLAEARDLATAAKVVEALLRGAGLASSFAFYLLEDDEYRSQLGDGPAVGADGPLARELASRSGPVNLGDVAEMILAPDEEELLGRLDCQLIAPLRAGKKLLGMVFLAREQDGVAYDGGERLAVELLCRELALRALRGKGAPMEPVERRSDDWLRSRVRQHQALLRLADELNGTHDEDQLLGTVLLALIGELGFAGACFLEDVGIELAVRCARGQVEEEGVRFPRPDDSELLGWRELRATDDEELPRELVELMGKLSDAGFRHAVPLWGRNGLLGLVALGERRQPEGAELPADFLAALLQQASVAIEHGRLVGELEHKTLRVARTLMDLVEKRSGNNAPTGLVSYWVDRVASAMNVPDDERREIVYGSVLRDIGMIEISDLVLRSPRSLSPEEWAQIKRHPITGDKLLRQMGFSARTCAVVHAHHERYNGEGYPDGLRGNDIPLGARIVSVVESFVAMVRDVPYRAALQRDEALAVLRENWQMRYDPNVVQAFVQLVESEPDALADRVPAELEQLLPGV